MRLKITIIAVLLLAAVAAVIGQQSGPSSATVGSTARLTVGVFALAEITQPVTNDTVVLQWEASDPDMVTGFNVYSGAQSGVYTNVIDVAEATSLEVTLVSGVTNYYAVTVYYDHDEITQSESDYSNELSLIKE